MTVLQLCPVNAIKQTNTEMKKASYKEMQKLSRYKEQNNAGFKLSNSGGIYNITGTYQGSLIPYRSLAIVCSYYRRITASNASSIYMKTVRADICR